MKWLNRLVFCLLICILPSCTGDDSTLGTAFNFTDINGPSVISLDPQLQVEQWEYLSWEMLEEDRKRVAAAWENGRSFNDDGIDSTRILETDTGFELYWFEFPCATKPVLLIRENSALELYGGHHPPPPIECEAMAVVHGMAVTLSPTGAIPAAEAWTFGYVMSGENRQEN